MGSTSATILFVLLTGSISNCFPVLETDDVNIGNWLNDEFVEESMSTSLADPVYSKTFIAFPTLDLRLQQPSVDFQAAIADSSVEDYSNPESIKHTFKKPVTPASLVQPSKYLEPPLREFGTNPKKAVSTYVSVYSPLPLLKNLKTPPSLDITKHRTFGIGPYGSTNPQRLALPSMLAAPLASTSLLKASPRSLETQSQTTTVSEVKVKEQKKLTKAGLKDRKLTKKTKTAIIKPVEETPSAVLPEFDEPSRILLPPARDFAIQLPKLLIPPTKKIVNGNSA